MNFTTRGARHLLSVRRRPHQKWHSRRQADRLCGHQVNGNKNADWAEKYLALLLGPQDQAVIKNNGFGGISPAFAVHIEAIPAGLQKLLGPVSEQQLLA